MTDSNRMLAATYTQGGALSIEDYRIAMKLVAGKRVDLSRIVSDIFPLSALQEAYDLALSGADGSVVVTAE